MNTVLVIDDEPDMVEILAHFLGRGFSVLTASSAAEARAVLSNQRCDVVVTDIRMPGEYGTTLIRDLKSTRPDLPVVVVSGSPPDEQAQVTCWLMKPIRRDELVGAVAAALNVKNGSR